MGGERTVSVTGASGYIGSFLVKRLLQRGYHVRATVRDPGNQKKVKHLLELANASTHLSLWKAELAEEGGYDDAIQGCQGVFHVAAPVELINQSQDGGQEEEIESTTLNGILSIMRSCSKAKTVKRLVYTSTTGTITVQPQPPAVSEFTEDLWSDIDLCYQHKMYGWMYVVAKTIAEKAAWKYAEENGIDMVTVHPSLVLGPFITPYTNISIDAAISLYTNEAGIASLKKLNGFSAVHVDDVCNAHIYLFENPLAKGRYICSSHGVNIFEIAHSLSLKYPDRNIPTQFEGLDEAQKIIPCSSKKLMDLGFEFAHKKKDTSDLCVETIESYRERASCDPKSMMVSALSSSQA
ncbi:dihydroflavonol 4-reductase isoform X2 [Daucus carota subsp. sativus]|uniref:dihydroflavonol 4-reductase isoform X2 n=1 Tax=Daucus carota subsp. sativus TaxID=79200 RepID=UPI0007EFE1F9|nr:PREDICTED: dihydroflavonol-4-reductase-like isoform X2 [Daucus carota subsp. sativus]